MYRLITAIIALLLALNIAAAAQSGTERFAAGHLVVIYRNHAIPANAGTILAQPAVHLPSLGLSLLQTDDQPATIARLRSRPEVAAVLHDRYVTAHALRTLPIRSRANTPPLPRSPINIPRPIAPIQQPILLSESPTDSRYNSPQGWAVLASGGFGDSIPNPTSPNPSGPWNTSLGAGVRIAILDSGIDAHHPDLAPNLTLNLSEINQSQLPSPCDDGGPQDQQGHGSFAASLAAAAIGGGNVIGVAPQATLLNVKVLQRMPATTSSNVLANCEAGEAGGLLSWVLQGIDDAVANHADILSLSLGTLIDTTTGDGAGWQAQFNAATYAASQAGIVIIAALGNDGLNLNANLIELPAQSRGVLPIVASTHPDCAEDLNPGAACIPGPITRPTYSNYGPPNAISAPGGNDPQASATATSGFIMGACTGGLPSTNNGLPSDGESLGCFALGHTPYVQAIGTSASAALVAGAAAILRAAHPLWSATKLIATLQATATPSTTQPEPHLNLPQALTSQ